VPDFEVLSIAERKELEQLRKLHKQASKVWATYLIHNEMHAIAVRDLCEMVGSMKESELGKHG
jgi:hypothetical protein